ncbi:ABC transporter ATP-binding protein [Clostridium sp. C105KSO13]|uniref:ABC transporter ATP-binding protein n=1 Tax=Clostridium sp. C105KSO13 TaxID=1776045 RepID=UPI000B7D56B8|nr:ABC transporter ATP-binding protein [Clostridium sp. C105KSO13]
MKTVLEVKNVSYSFHTYGGIVRAVRDVSFDLKKGEILGIVGESGCGKSVTAQCILRLNPEPPGFFEQGSILYQGEDIVNKNEAQMRKLRSDDIGFIFQDPMTSLNPTMTIGRQIEEVLIYHKEISKSKRKQLALDILHKVGISDAEKRYKQYPHELSGGMKQRIMIAIALVRNPDIIIADEPTTSLDVTIEAQILDLLKQLQQEMGTSVILITHDLGVIASMCDRVLVMYGGKIVETGTVDEVFYEFKHPYTAGLLNSIAGINTPKDTRLISIEGTPPDLFNPPAGCPFAARCRCAMEVCYKMPPKNYEISAGHETMCWLQHESAPSVDLLKEFGRGSAVNE